MEQLRPCLFIYLLAILLSLSISSTTNSEHTNTDIFEWKGGDGAKRPRVRRQDLHLPNALSLPEKAYGMFILWRLLNDVSNDTNTNRTSMRPDKLESISSEGPKNTEIVFKAKDKPSSAPTKEQSTHSTGITGTNDSTDMASFPTEPSPPDSQKTTQSGDSQLIKQSTSLLLTVETPISHLNGFTSDPEHHKPTPAEEPRNQTTEQNAINTSNDGLMKHFMTTKTRILTSDLSVSSKTASTSPVLNLTEDHLVDSKGPGDTSVSKDISLQVSTSSAAPFTTYQMNPKTQSQSTTKKFPILGTIISHTSVLLAKNTSTRAPTDKVRTSQTIPIPTKNLTVTFAPNPKPSEKHIHTTSVMRRGFLTLITQEIPSWISTKQSNLHPTETTEPRSDLTNQEPTADTVAKQKYPNNDNDLLTEVGKPTQSTTGRKMSKTTRTATTKLHMSKTQKVSRNPKKFILPTHKSADTAIKDDTETHRRNFGLLFTFGCSLLLMMVILLWVVWRRWQAQRWRHNMWVAGPPLLCGTYHSVLQSSSTHTAIEMRRGNTQKSKQENSDVHERIALKQQHKDLQ